MDFTHVLEANFTTAQFKFDNNLLTHTYDANALTPVAYFPRLYTTKNRNANQMHKGHRITLTVGPYSIDIMPAGKEINQDTVVVAKCDTRDEQLVHTESLIDVIPTEPRYMYVAVQNILNRIVIKQFTRARLFGTTSHTRLFFIDPQHNDITPPRIQALPDVTSVLADYMRENDCMYVEHIVHTITTDDGNRMFIVFGLFKNRYDIFNGQNFLEHMLNIVNTFVELHERGNRDMDDATERDLQTVIWRKASLELSWAIKKHVPKTDHFDPEISLIATSDRLAQYFASIRQLPEIEYMLEELDLSDHVDAVNEQYFYLIDAVENSFQHILGTTELA